MQIPNNVRYVIDTLQANCFEAYLVGGCVRDSIMGIKPKDYDITTNAFPEDILKCFADDKTLTNGIKHGTVTVLSDGECVEVTTFRIDGEYSDLRHPNKVTFSGKLSDDLLRRDFTVNAIAYSDKNGFVDPFCGKKDIEDRIIRCVGCPEKRFNEDALRIMRALRFSSVLGVGIESKTSKAIINNAQLLKNISKERVFSELTKLLMGENAPRVIEEYATVFKTIAPAFEKLNENTFEEISKILEKCDSRKDNIVLSLCCFFCVFSETQNCAELVEAMLRDLKSPAKTAKTVSIICSSCEMDLSAGRIFARKLASKLGYNNAFLLLRLISAKYPEKSDTCDNLIANLKALKKNNECIDISGLSISGNDLMTLGIPKGSAIGKILGLLLCEVIEEKTVNSKNALLERAKQISGKGVL